jgi:hypothetical protein
VDFQPLSNITRIELDKETGWVKVTCLSGEVFLIQPRDLLALTTWSQGNTQTLVASQQAIERQSDLYSHAIQGQARPIRLVDPRPQEDPGTTLPKVRSRKPLPLPTIHISEALPCLLLCKTMTMTALLDFGTGPHDPWQLYPFCEDHLRQIRSERDATGLSLRALVQQRTQTPSS